MKKHIQYANILQIVCDSTTSRDAEGLVEIAMAARVVYERLVVIPVKCYWTLRATKPTFNASTQSRYRIIFEVIKLFTPNAFRFPVDHTIEHRGSFAHH
jgi:hypothetical protein